MKLLAVILTSLFLILLNLPLTITGNLATDTDALLTFARGLPRTGDKLDWTHHDKVDHVCTWRGVTCTLVRRLQKKSGRVTEYITENRVTKISLPAVGLFGPIVAKSIGKLDALEILSLGFNTLYGNIPPDILAIDTLRFLILHHNRFCGDIPRFKKFPPRLQIVDLSFNSFTGQIPPVFSMLKGLTNLSLENNEFAGEIPDIDLQRHRMFNKMLPYLNLSYNRLEGPIPVSLQIFSKDSFIGNLKLCGKPLVDCSLLAPAPAPLSTAPFSQKVGAIAFVASLMILFLLV